VLGREVLNDDIRHAALGRARRKESPQHLDATGGGANAHHGKGERGPSRKVDRGGRLIGRTRGRRGGREAGILIGWTHGGFRPTWDSMCWVERTCMAISYQLALANVRYSLR